MFRRGSARSEVRSLLVREAKAPSAPRAYLPLPVLHQGPHEDDVSQGGEVPLAGQWGVCLTARLSFSGQTGLVYQEVCDLGQQREKTVESAFTPSELVLKAQNGI